MIYKKNEHNLEKLAQIWKQVPADYYQQGIANNLLQKIWHTGKLNALIKLIEDRPCPPQKVLDVGCASGWFLSKIAKKYPKAECCGVDIYKEAIEYGKKRYKNLQLMHADAHILPFPNNSFDLVICTETLEHVVDPVAVLKEIRRVLTKNGNAIIEMDTGNLLFRIIWYWWTNLRQGVWKGAHIHRFRAKKLENMLHSTSLAIQNKKTFNLTMAVVFSVKK